MFCKVHRNRKQHNNYVICFKVQGSLNTLNVSTHLLVAKKRKCLILNSRRDNYRDKSRWW